MNAFCPVSAVAVVGNPDFPMTHPGAVPASHQHSARPMLVEVAHHEDHGHSQDTRSRNRANVFRRSRKLARVSLSRFMIGS